MIPEAFKKFVFAFETKKLMEIKIKQKELKGRIKL